MPRHKLRLGLMLDSYELPAWAYSAISPLASSHYAELSLIILKHATQTPPRAWRSFLSARQHIVYDAFSILDSYFHRSIPDPSAPVDVRPLLRDVPVVQVTSHAAADHEQLTPDAIRIIREKHLDLLIKLGFGSLTGEILTAARYGIWAYHHGDIKANPDGPSGFWEVVEDWPETGFSLIMLGEESTAHKILYSSSSFTHPYSPARNMRYCQWASSPLLSRQVRLLYLLGEKGFWGAVEKYNLPLDLRDHPPYGKPPNAIGLYAVSRLLLKLFSRACQKAVYLDQWHLLYGHQNAAATRLFSFRTLLPPKDRFWADPCVIHTPDGYYIFVEEYLYRQKKGRIAVIIMDQHGQYADSSVVLERDYHLSYPFVFERDGRYFMVPESSENKSVDLYECFDFPHGWKLRLSLMKNVNAVDTTLISHQGKWWLFTGMAEHEGSLPLVELFLFHSTDLITDKWAPHPWNPIVSDVKRARPAGRIFRKEGRLFRPSQDCSESYGHGFDLNEILLLSDDEYQEKKVASVRPRWDKRVRATHTFSSDGELTVIDALRLRRRLF